MIAGLWISEGWPVVDKKRRKHTAEFKAKVALEALKERRTVNEIGAEHEVHPVQVSQWKKAAAEGLAHVFANPASASRAEAAREALIARLYQEVGQLKVELDWLQKKVGRAR